LALYNKLTKSVLYLSCFCSCQNLCCGGTMEHWNFRLQLVCKKSWFKCYRCMYWSSYMLQFCGVYRIFQTI